jgi:hypothetical protein
MDARTTLHQADDARLPEIPRLKQWLGNKTNTFSFIIGKEGHHRVIRMAHEWYEGHMSVNISSRRHGLRVPGYSGTLQNDLMYDVYISVLDDYRGFRGEDVQKSLLKKYDLLKKDAGPQAPIVYHLPKLREETARRLFDHVLNTKMGNENTNTKMFQTLNPGEGADRASGISDSRFWLHNHVLERIYISAARTWHKCLTEGSDEHYMKFFLNAGAERLRPDEYRSRTMRALKEGWV